VSGHRSHRSPQGLQVGRTITRQWRRDAKSRSSGPDAARFVRGATKPRPSISTTSESATSSMCERPWLRKPVRVGCVPPPDSSTRISRCQGALGWCIAS